MFIYMCGLLLPTQSPHIDFQSIFFTVKNNGKLLAAVVASIIL